MKRIFLSLLALCSTVSATSFAMEIENGKVIDHKEWITGNAKGFFNPNNKNREGELLQLNLFKSQLKQKLVKQIDELIYLSNEILPLNLNGPISTNTVVDFHGDAFGVLANSTSSIQEYATSYHFCIFDTSKDYVPLACLEGTDQYRLYPQAINYMSSNPVLSYVFTEPGTYYLSLRTSATRNHATLSFETERHAWISVVDNKSGSGLTS